MQGVHEGGDHMSREVTLFLGDVRVRAVTETNPDGTLARDVHL